ncbi:MAG: F0F1 ATP synthase subunit delta [Candidatus Staskawiczbacteria bacterium]|nr:F0F1 ATP synthase subunit delta [Candidatus Staskawiczbacteria bacterium]
MAKQNKVKLYAKALAEVILGKKPARQNAGAFGAKETNTDEIVKNFIKVLDKNGQTRRAKEILNLAEDMILRKQGKNKITFEIARRLASEHRVMLKEFVKEGDVVKEKINHELIAGVKIVVNGDKQLDMTMRKKLGSLFDESY